MRTFVWLTVIVLLLICAVTFAFQQRSQLATVASSMAPGEWREISSLMLNLNDASVPGYFSNRTGEDIWQIDGNTFVNQYTDVGGRWDSVKKVLHWDGVAHSGYYRHIKYDDASNRWSMIGDNWISGRNDSTWYDGKQPYLAMALYPDFKPYGVSAPRPTSHAYHNFTIHPAGRYYYHWAGVTTKINRLHLDTGVWDDFPVDVPAGNGQNGVLLWHSGLNNGAGGLVFTPGGTAWWAFDGTKWIALPQLAVGQRSNMGEYSPQAGVALMGGGLPGVIGLDPFNPKYQDPAHPDWAAGKTLYRMKADRSVNKAADAPLPVVGTLTIMTVDPATGEFLFLFRKTPSFLGNNDPKYTELWSYNATTDAWKKRVDQPPFDPFMLGDPLQGMMAASIDTYGVTMWIKHDGHTSRVWLYRHDANSSPPPNPNSAFAQKIKALGSAMIGAYGFDSASNVRNYPAGIEPLKYTWLHAGQGDAYHNSTVGSQCDQAFAGQTWYPGGLGTANANAEATVLINPARCNYPVIDNGSLKLTVPTKSWAGATGRFKAPMAGMGSTAYVGPGSPLGNVLYAQYRYRLGPTAHTFYMAGNSGWKTFIFEGAGALSAVQQMTQDYGDPGCPLGAASCPKGSLPLFTAYGSIGADGWGQEVRGCGYNYNNRHPLYKEPPCLLMHNQQWYEITTRIEFRPSTTSASTPGAGSTTLNWPNGRFLTAGFTDIYIEGGTNFVPGLYHVASVISNSQVRLDTSPTPSGAGSGGTLYYSYDNNSKFQTWVDGAPVIDSQTAKYAWGPHGAGKGWHNFDLNVYITNKDETQDHPAVDIWYDDVLFATQPIPMSPGASRSGSKN